MWYCGRTFLSLSGKRMGRVTNIEVIDNPYKPLDFSLDSFSEVKRTARVKKGCRGYAISSFI